MSDPMMRGVLSAVGAARRRVDLELAYFVAHDALCGDEWVSFGSHNLDYYSPRYCCETNLMVRDGRLARLLTDFFETGVADATPLSLDGEVRPCLGRHSLLHAFDRGFRDFQ